MSALLSEKSRSRASPTRHEAWGPGPGVAATLCFRDQSRHRVDQVDHIAGISEPDGGNDRRPRPHRAPPPVVAGHDARSTPGPQLLEGERALFEPGFLGSATVVLSDGRVEFRRWLLSAQRRPSHSQVSSLDPSMMPPYSTSSRARS